MEKTYHGCVIKAVCLKCNYWVNGKNKLGSYKCYTNGCPAKARDTYDSEEKKK